MAKREDPGSWVCPQCNVKTPVRMKLGEVCPTCAERNAWEARDGQKVVVTHGDISAVEKRLAGEAAGEGWLRKALTYLPSALALALAGVAGTFTIALFRTVPVGPLQPIFDGMKFQGAVATVAGFHALAIGGIALWRLRKSRHFRRAMLLGASILAMAGGVAASAVGGLYWLATSGLDLEYLSMPERAAAVLESPDVERIMNATAVVVAPDKDGNGRNAAIGTGSVIFARAGRAWVLTNSHVAMPYASTAAWRKAHEAHPVWVQFADGQSAQGKVRWTARPPLDVALVEVPLDHPPAPVALSPSSGELDVMAPVTFVPNPYRHGWLVHRGHVQRREEHVTPAGEYSLLFTTLPVQPGDSGSGLFDAQGRLVGLNTWTRINDGAPFQGISLPAEAMRVIVDAIDKGELEQIDQRLPEKGHKQ